MTWGEFHTFSILRSSSQIVFGIDGVAVAAVAGGYSGSLAVAVWDDRDQQMLTNYVRVLDASDVPEPPTTLLVFPLVLALGAWIRYRSVHGL